MNAPATVAALVGHKLHWSVFRAAPAFVCQTSGVLCCVDKGLLHLTVTPHLLVQADVQALTRERDDLSKKLYWAEMARDQTKAAKALAAEDAIKARCVCLCCDGFYHPHHYPYYCSGPWCMWLAYPITWHMCVCV